jgi:hypothetical protein
VGRRRLLAAAPRASPRGHREDTAIIVLKGELRVQRGDEEFSATSGQSVFLPRDVPHSFLVVSDHAHFYELVTPGGIEGFHIEASDPAPAAELPPPGPPDVARLIAALGPYDAEIVGPPMVMPTTYAVSG